MNLPAWRSVAPVKAPFSWPNRIDSDQIVRDCAAIDRDERLGCAARREPWIARAISSLPTPDWPSISTGMADAAAFSAVRSTACMPALRVMMSANVSVPARLRLMRLSSPCSALAASALRSDTCSRSAPTGLTTKSPAPARMAETTLSMPPCAVCTMTGMRDAGLAQSGEHAEPVEVGHDQVEHDRVDRRAVRRRSGPDRRRRRLRADHRS